MNPRESTVLETFLEQLIDARAVQKDSQAATMIERAVAQQPDAAYLLVQRVLLLQEALERARVRIAHLESSPPPFLDSGPPPWSDPGREPLRGNPASSGNSLAPVPLASTGPTQSFLGRAASTAAGVAGGAFLFEGLENLMGPHAVANGAATAVPSEQLTVNNYFGDDEAQDARGTADESSAWNGASLKDNEDDFGLDQGDDEFV